VTEFAVLEQYGDTFRFIGTIKHVTVDLSSELIPDAKADLKIAL
jgi:hypothetical protein